MLDRARLALAALRLYRDPDRLDEVLASVTHLAPPEDAAEMARALRASSPDAESAFRERRVMRWDPRDLARCAPGTLGRAVHDHCAAWDIHPRAFPARPLERDADYAVAHIESTHDVWHPVTGFGNDVPGELGLQAFYLAQFPNLLALFLFAIGHARALLADRALYPRLMDEIARGWEMGKRAAPLFGVRWDAMWDRPLADVRRELRIGA